MRIAWIYPYPLFAGKKGRTAFHAPILPCDRIDPAVNHTGTAIDAFQSFFMHDPLFLYGFYPLPG